MGLQKQRACLLLAFILCGTQVALGQSRFYNHWYFGYGLGLDFTNGTPLPVNGSLRTYEGCASISDSGTGDLLFYTDGTTVWNREHAVMLNGTGLFGNFSTTQSALIAPLPDNEHIYYVFTLDARTAFPQRGFGLNYSVVDMRGDNGLGEVVEKNINLLSSASEKLVGIRHGVGCGYWIVTHEVRGNRFFAWHLTAHGLIMEPVVSGIGNVYRGDTTEGNGPFEAGSLKASPDGSYLFASHVARSFAPATGELFRFNTLTGIVGPKVDDFITAYDASFSPNNDFLYTAEDHNLVQYNLQLPPGTIVANRAVINVPTDSGWPLGMQLGPDGKVYVISFVDYPRVGVINSPNEYGMDADFTPDLFLTDSTTPLWLAFPNCIDGYLGESNPASPGLPLVATVAGDTMICPGETTRLRAEGGKWYRWSPSDGLSCDTCREPLAAPSSTITYTLVAYSDQSCPGLDSTTVTVVVHAPPHADAGPDTAICAGTSIQLRATGGVSYKWKPAEELGCTDCPDPIASPESSRTFVVTVTDESGCTASDTVRITVHGTAARVVASDTLICFGDTVTLEATGGREFQWQPIDGLSCVDCSTTTAAPQRTTTYIVSATDNGICPTYDSVTITLRGRPAADAGEDVDICAGEAVQLQAAGVGSYRWDTTPGLSCYDCPDPTVRPAETTLYYLTVVNGECEERDSVRVVVRPLPIIDVGLDTAICEGESVQLNATGGASYRWNSVADLSCLDCPEPIASPDRTTMFYVTGISADGCEAKDSIRVVVYPGVTVAAGPDRTICAGDVVRLEASGGVRRLWEPPDGLSCPDCPDPVAFPAATTTYRVTAWNAEGCEGSDEVTVFVRRSREALRLRIGRDHRGVTGQPLTIPVEIVDPIDQSDVSELELTLEYDPTVMLIDEASIGRGLDGTAVEGWRVEIVENVPGRLRLRLTAPTGETLSGSGMLLRFESRMYLSNILGTEIPLRVGTSSRCFEFATEPGYAKVDSVCGINFRLIELTAQKYVAPIAYPNPARDRVTFEFGLGLDGETRLEVFDVSGKSVGVIVNELLGPGRYSVQWDVREVPSGLYWYRLLSGDWRKEGQLRIRR